MKFRRKSASSAAAEASSEAGAETSETIEVPFGPYDVDDIPEPMRGLERVDLGSLLIAPIPNCELRLQIDERTEEVQAVLLTTDEGALEIRAFAASRGGNLWDEVRPQLAADIDRRGGQSQEVEGVWGTHLVGQMPTAMPDGTQSVQASRIIGINGPRWMLRATLIGRPAVDADYANVWLQGIAASAVRRGAHALPVGEALPLTMPPQREA